MTKAYWISLYKKVDNQENLKKYAEIVTPIIKSYGGKALVRGGKYNTYDEEAIIYLRTVVWEFPNYQRLSNVISQKSIKQDAIAKGTTLRHMQIVEGF